MSLLKSICSVVLVVNMIIMSWVPFFAFKYQQIIIRKEIKSYIKNGVPEEQRIIFIADELEADAVHLTWIHSKEFRYRGEMYDILDEKIIDGRTYYICIHDVKESGLFAKLDEMVDKGLQTNAPLNSQSKMLQHICFSMFFEKDSIMLIFRENQSDIFKEAYFKYSFSLIPPDTPPPKNV